MRGGAWRGCWVMPGCGRCWRKMGPWTATPRGTWRPKGESAPGQDETRLCLYLLLPVAVARQINKKAREAKKRTLPQSVGSWSPWRSWELSGKRIHAAHPCQEAEDLKCACAQPYSTAGSAAGEDAETDPHFLGSSLLSMVLLAQRTPAWDAASMDICFFCSQVHRATTRTRIPCSPWTAVWVGSLNGRVDGLHRVFEADVGHKGWSLWFAACFCCGEASRCIELHLMLGFLLDAADLRERDACAGREFSIRSQESK